MTLNSQSDSDATIKRTTLHYDLLFVRTDHTISDNDVISSFLSMPAVLAAMM